jgi:hypothetical protein
MDYNVIKITREQLLQMEHDFIVARRERTKNIIQIGNVDEMVAASDFMIYIEAITSFVDELLGDEPIGE